jgi:transposase InsO family protein
LRTIYKWKKRESTQDKSHTRHNLLSSVSEREEAIISELRTKVGLSVDGITRVMQECINPKLSRSAIYRAMKRCGVNRLPEADKNQPHSQPFETVTEYGHIHMDVKYLPKLEGIRSYLYVAIDRMTRYVYAEVLCNLEPKTAAGFVERFTKHFPYKLKKIITDNGFEWTDRCAGGVKFKSSGTHPVDVVCQKERVKHVLTRIRRPQTNGMVERFNRRVNEAIAQRGKITDNGGKNTFPHLERNTYIINFVEAYNRTTLQCLNYRAPSSVLFDNHPEGNTLRGNDI